MKTVYEASRIKGTANVSCVKYRNLNNIPHYHSDYELVYVNEGKAAITVQEKIFNLSSGECVFIHGDEIHDIRSDGSAVVTVLKAKRKYLEGIFVSRRLASPRISAARDTENALREIEAELKSCAEHGDIMADSIAMRLFITIIRREQTVRDESSSLGKQGANELYNEISRKISAEYSTVTFKEAAKYMHFSEPYFSKVFRRIFGMTFTRYLSTVRVAAAIERIREGGMSMTEISASCGFGTIRNFNRVFKELTGFSPNTMPSDHVFLYSLQDGYTLDPTLNCTEIVE